MNKLWLLLLIPILLVGFSCVSSDEPAAANSLTTKIQSLSDTVLKHTSVIDTLRVDVDKKATKTEIDDLSRKINNLPQGGAPSDVYTKAQVDQKVADAISALKSDQAWIKGSGAAGTSDAGKVNVTLNPASVPPIWSSPYTSGAGGFSQFTLHIVNNSTVIQYAKPLVILSSNTQLMVRKVNISMNGNGYNMYMTANMTDAGTHATTYESNINGTAGTQQVFSLQPWGSTSSSLSISPTLGFGNNVGEIYLNPGQAVDVNVNIGVLLTDLNTGQYNISAMVIPHT